MSLRTIYNFPKADFYRTKENELYKKLYNITPIDHALSYLKFTKKGSVQKLIHQIKYGNKPELATIIGYQFGEQLKKNDYQGLFDIIIPLPLHQTRLKKRGYNQSDFFAEGISKSLKIPWKKNILERVIKTDVQAAQTKTNRWKNVEHAFSIKDENSLIGKSTLLVDDVITTGATICACADVILPLCKTVSIASIAVAEL